MAFFDAHDGERLHAIRRDAEFLARLHDRVRSHAAVIGRHRQLVGMFAGKRYAKKPRRNAAEHLDVLRGEIRKGRVVKHDAIDDLLQRGARLGTGDRHLRPLLRYRDVGHVEIGPQGLMAEFHMRHDAGGVRCCRRHQEMIGRQPRRCAVVEDDAVLTQHQAVTRAADGQRREGIAVEPVEEGGRRPCPARRSCRGWKHRKCRRAPACCAPHGSHSPANPRLRCGNHAERSHKPVSTKTAPSSAAHSCSGVLRTGWK